MGLLVTEVVVLCMSDGFSGGAESNRIRQLALWGKEKGQMLHRNEDNSVPINVYFTIKYAIHPVPGGSSLCFTNHSNISVIA